MTRDKPNPMWGGRFDDAPAGIMLKINASIHFDKRLWREDIQASIAHAAMLQSCAIIGKEDSEQIIAGLERIRDEFERDGVTEQAELEDIHMTIEHRLTELIGPIAGRLHTARSRNDQVATDFKLWVRSACERAIASLIGLQRALVTRAEEHAETIMPGFTHMQVAQPVTLGHYLLGYYEMLRRDVSRFMDAKTRMDECPLGSAALAGTSFPIDRHEVARRLGFGQPSANSMDSVSDRDFALDYLAASAQAALHLSRLAEELILWSSPIFGFIRLSDAFSTGSSIMPQKRNPDAAELARGHSGRILGLLAGLMTTMKGLPLGYSKDMQDDKEPVFEAHDLLAVSLDAMTGMIASARFNPEPMLVAAAKGHSTATDLADWLVQKAALPFRDAHRVAGLAVRAADERNCALSDLELETLRGLEPGIDVSLFKVLTVEASAKSRTSYGGTAPIRVREQVAIAKSALERLSNDGARS